MKSSCYTKLIEYIVPISKHHSYTRDLEHSDKVILPLSVYYEIKAYGIPSDGIFLLLPLKPCVSPVYVSPLSYTAEEGFIYVPDRMLRALEYYISNP